MLCQTQELEHTCMLLTLRLFRHEIAPLILPSVDVSEETTPTERRPCSVRAQNIALRIAELRDVQPLKKQVLNLVRVDSITVQSHLRSTAVIAPLSLNLESFASEP